MAKQTKTSESLPYDFYTTFHWWTDGQPPFLGALRSRSACTPTLVLVWLAIYTAEMLNDNSKYEAERRSMRRSALAAPPLYSVRKATYIIVVLLQRRDASVQAARGLRNRICTSITVTQKSVS